MLTASDTMAVALHKLCLVVNLTELHLFCEEGSSLLEIEAVPGVVFCEVRNVKGFDRKRIAAVMLGITCSKIVSAGGFWVIPFSPSMARELWLPLWLTHAPGQSLLALWVRYDDFISGDC